MTFREATLDDLTRVLRDVAGQDEGVDLDEGILDSKFADLGYDSLALLETGARLERALGVRLDDSTLNEVDTPRELLSAINQKLAVPQ